MRLIAPRAKAGKKRAEAGRYNVRAPAAYTRSGKKLDMSFSRGSFDSWKATRDAAEHAILTHTEGAQTQSRVAPVKKVRKTAYRKRRKRRRRQGEAPRTRWTDTTTESDETCLSRTIDTTTDSDTGQNDDWWERGNNNRENRKRGRVEPQDDEGPTHDKEDSGTTHRPAAAQPMRRSENLDLFGEDGGGHEESPEDHDDMIRLPMERVPRRAGTGVGSQTRRYCPGQRQAEYFATALAASGTVVGTQADPQAVTRRKHVVPIARTL